MLFNLREITRENEDNNGKKLITKNLCNLVDYARNLHKFRLVCVWKFIPKIMISHVVEHSREEQ